MFSVYLLQYIYIVIVITALVTTFCAIYSCSRRPVQVTDRKKFLVCRQESKSEYDHLFELPIRAARTCTVQAVYKRKGGTKAQMKRKVGSERGQERKIFISFAVFACLLYTVYTISWYSIIIVFDTTTQDDGYPSRIKKCVHKNIYRQKQTAAHSRRIIYYCTHSISDGFVLLLLFFAVEIFAWRIYCHHRNLIVLPLCQWLFNLTCVVIVIVAHFIASVEQTVSMLVCTWTRKHQFTGSIASNLTCEFFRLH